MPQEPTFAPEPRVRFLEPESDGGGDDLGEEEEPQLVVALPRKQVVSPQVTPKPILKPPKYVVDSDSIAAWVKAHRTAPVTPAEGSIAEPVAQRRREAANSVLDQETGQLLEYRQLL